MQVWLAKSGKFDRETIFETLRNGTATYLRNVESEVYVGGGYVFRNPPHFASFTPSHVTDHQLEHEADALIND